MARHAEKYRKRTFEVVSGLTGPGEAVVAAKDSAIRGCPTHDVATDRGAHLTFYGERTHGRHSPCLFLRPDGVLYGAVLGLFEFTWSDASPYA